MTQWPRPQWVTILGPYLTGLPQVVLKMLPGQDVTDYNWVKAALVDCYETTEETQQQRFRVLRYKNGDRPKALVTGLREYATMWLKLGTLGERAITEKVVLEQVFYAMPPAVRAWLMQAGPTSLDQAAAYLENYFLADQTMAHPDLILGQ